jgi:cell division protein FtsW (lipid II flippase)
MNQERMQRPARIIGMVAALIVVAFVFLLVGQAQPDAAGVGIAYIVAGAVVLLAPRGWAAGAAIATAVVTGLLTVAGAGDLDGVFRGRAEAQAFYARVLSTLGPDFRVPPYNILVHDASLIVVPRGSTFGDAGQGLDVYHFEGGLISEVWLTAWKSSQHTPMTAAN